MQTGRLPRPARTRRVWFLPVVLVVLAVAMAACGSDDSDPGAGSGDPDSGTPVSLTQLQTGTWKLKSYAANAAGDLQGAVAASPSTALFASGRISGTTGCNQYSGDFTLSSGGEIKIGSVAQTSRACSDALNAQEKGFTTGLADAKKVVTADGVLQMLDKSGDVVLIFSP